MTQRLRRRMIISAPRTMSASAGSARQQLRQARLARGGASRALGGAQLGRAGARIGGDLGLVGDDRRLVRRRKVGAGAVRRPAGGASRRRVRLRSARNVFTMRSSSEWKVTTTSRPPGVRMRSAAASAAHQFAQLVVDEDAQRLERARRRMDVARPAPHHARRRCRPAPGGVDRRLLARARRWRGRRRANGAPRRAGR